MSQHFFVVTNFFVYSKSHKFAFVADKQTNNKYNKIGIYILAKLWFIFAVI